MSESVFGRRILNPFLQILFLEMTAADGGEAAASALHTRWAVTPAAWTVFQKQTQGLEVIICIYIIDVRWGQQNKLTDFAILWKCSASFCLPDWKQMFRKKVNSGSRSLIWESADGKKVKICLF